MYTVYRYKNQYGLTRYIAVENGCTTPTKCEAAIFEGLPDDCRRIVRILNYSVTPEGVTMIDRVKEINQTILN